MDFRKFLEMISEESTAEKDDKAEKAGEEVTKDIEHDDKEDKKKKSLKDWFEQLDKEMLNEAEQIQLVPASQKTQVIKQGTKTLGTVTNPALAAQIKQSIGKGEMSLAGSEIKEEEMEESGLQAYLGKKKYGEKGMKALQKAGREGASKEKMAQIRAQHDKLDEVQVDEKAVNPYAVGMAAAKKAAGIKKKHATDLPKSVIVKGHEIAKKIKKKEKTSEAEIPSAAPDYGAGLGAGRSDKVLEAKPDFLDLDKDGNKKETMKKAAADKKKKVKESMNTLEAAYHEGKSHGLSKHGYACRYNEGSEEHKRYHDGFKEGLDECYGLMPNRGLVGETVPATVPGMANQAAGLGEMDKTAYMQHKAKTTPGDTFKAFGQTMQDKDVLEMDAFAFESLDKQLNDLLKEEVEIVKEGVSVNMSQGLGGMGDDSVSVTATADDAGKLLDFIKQVGLGGLGGAQAEVIGGAEPVVAVASDYGAPKFADHGHDGMKALMAKVKGDDYEQEGTHGEAPKATEGEMCSECGMMEEKCGCEHVEETETADQRLYQMAENAPDSEEAEHTADEEAEASEDAALAKADQQDKEVTVNEGGDGGEASEEPEMTEEKLDEWANEAGKKGTDAAFERDIEFMTKVISGGLNKPKSTGQTTIPVIAGQEDRMGVTEDSDVAEWKRLAGLQ